MNAEKTGILIYEMRSRKGLTQKELAEKCNVSDKAVSKWERGDGCPDVTVLPKLAEAFGLEVESIMNGEIPFSQDVSDKTIKEYNFRQPDRYPRYMQRELWMLGEDICQLANREFTAIVNDRCEFNCDNVDQMTNKEFLDSIPQKCFFYDFGFADGAFTIEVDYQLAKALLKQDSSRYDLITAFDLEIIKNYFLRIIYELVAQNMLKQTDGKLDIKSKFPFEKAVASATSSNARQLENHMMLLLALKGRTGGEEGWMNLQFSDIILEDLLLKGFFGSGDASGGFGGANGGKIKFQNLSNIKSRELPDNIFIEFGRFRPENVLLEPGTILILDKKEKEGLNVVFENRVIHTGKTVAIDDLFGIEVAESTQLSEIVYDEKDYLSVQLGSTALTKQEIAALHQGSYILLKQRAGEMTQIIRAGKVVAYGEICIVDDNFGIRLVEVKGN
ncbi:MAG: FliM/FliN family flagellar motor switch protein [Treponemataceae bacterium]|nr:FliM/FliN family flagellar motor switch protein [Treponemataceae bacterium]